MVAQFDLLAQQAQRFPQAPFTGLLAFGFRYPVDVFLLVRVGEGREKFIRRLFFDRACSKSFGTMTGLGWSSMARITFIRSPADCPVSLCIVLLLWMTCAPLPLGQAESAAGFFLNRQHHWHPRFALGDKANAVHAPLGL